MKTSDSSNGNTQVSDNTSAADANAATITQPKPLSTRIRNPWALAGPYNPDLHGRFQVDMPKEDYNFFRSINPMKGSMQAMCNILLDKLQLQLKANGITNVTQCAEFCDFVSNIRLTDGRRSASASASASATEPARSTTSGPVSKAGASNVSGRKTRTSSKNPQHAK